MTGAQADLFGVPAAVWAHPLWPLLRPYVKAEAAGAGDAKKQRYRIEVDRLPPSLLGEALSMRVRCCACERSIHPIRLRRPPGNKRDDVVGHCPYYACACPLDVNVGCSRGKAAKANYAAVVALVMAHEVPQA